MRKIEGIFKFAVDGDDAPRLYEIFKKSYLVETGCQPFEGCNLEIDFSFEDGVFTVEEKATSGISNVAEILYFFADKDHITCLEEPEIEVVVVKSNNQNDELPF